MSQFIGQACSIAPSNIKNQCLKFTDNQQLIPASHWSIERWDDRMQIEVTWISQSLLSCETNFENKAENSDCISIIQSQHQYHTNIQFYAQKYINRYFSLDTDPFEKKNIYKKFPNLVHSLLKRLREYDVHSIPFYYPDKETGKNPL